VLHRSANPLVFALTVGAAALATVAAGAAVGAPNPAPAHADVSYGPGPNQKIDIYLPPKGGGPYPVVSLVRRNLEAGQAPARLDFFFKAKCAVIGVQTRTMTDAVERTRGDSSHFVRGQGRLPGRCSSSA